MKVRTVIELQSVAMVRVDESSHVVIVTNWHYLHVIL